MKRKQKNGTNGVVSDDGFETIGGAAGQEMGIGEVVTGTYHGIVREMSGKKRGSKIPFYQVGDRAIMGATVLKSRVEEAIKLGKLTEGKTVRVTRLEDGRAKPGQNAPKIYKFEVKRS